MPRPQPDPDPDGFWPSCDDQPPGVSIRPLNHADLAALLAHLDHTRPGRHPQLGGAGAGAGDAGAGWRRPPRRLRPRRIPDADGPPSWPSGPTACPGGSPRSWPSASPPGCWPPRSFPTWRPWLASPWRPGWPGGCGSASAPDTVAWRRGAAGERRTARLLAPLERRGWAVLHDLAIPGTQANIDHLVIGPGGVVAIDTKQYRGRLQLDPDGLLWHGRHLLLATLRKSTVGGRPGR